MTRRTRRVYGAGCAASDAAGGRGRLARSPGARDCDSRCGAVGCARRVAPGHASRRSRAAGAASAGQHHEAEDHEQGVQDAEVLAEEAEQRRADEERAVADDRHGAHPGGGRAGRARRRRPTCRPGSRASSRRPRARCRR